MPDISSRLAHFGFIMLAAALLWPAIAAGSEYRVDVGDVIEISIARAPELQRRISIKLDGTISFPFLGTVPVAGLTQAQLQAKVQAGLAAKIFQQRTSSGRDSDVAIEPDEVTATVVEY